MNKPIPQTQSELLRSSIDSYLPDRLPKVAPTTNRAESRSVRGDVVRDFSVGFEDIDKAIIYYFNNVIRPSVVQNGKKVQVPIIYGSQERWAGVQRDGFYRDKNGKIQCPIIMYKRDNITKNRRLGNKLDANNPRNFIIFEKKYSKENIYDRFGILNSRVPEQEFYGVIMPDYVTITYSCIIFTDYIEQMNKIVEGINFASDSYWGQPEKFKFRAMIEDFSNTVDLVQGEDRKIKTEFTIDLLGYIISDNINAQVNGMNKYYSKSSIKFNVETARSLKELDTRANRSQTQFFDGPVRVVNINNFNKVEVGAAIVEFAQEEPAVEWTFNHNLNLKYPVITVYDANDKLVLPVSTLAVDENTLILTFPFPFTGKVTAVGRPEESLISVLSAAERQFLTLVTTLDSNLDSYELDSTGYIVRFKNVQIITPPIGYSPLTVSDFKIFINGMRIEISAIDSIVQDGNDIVVTFNQTLDYSIDVNKEVVIIGKIIKL